MVLGSGKEIEVVGDRVLILPDQGEERTEVGLYLPRPASEKATVQAGTIVEVGPGLLVVDATPNDEEPWKSDDPEPRHAQMQATVGDYAVFLRKPAVEIRLEGQNYLVVPHSAILVLVRDHADPPDEPPEEF
ncbi:MAG: co-chaperone GroES family protein [Candidatus Eisenbacteria bacterium]|jgi:co-chaperonin GroES (HSP10)|nr:co-chaperone GroES family protein [Candidatus Eisenbacteria bacterium]